MSRSADAASALQSLNLDELQQFLNTVKTSNTLFQLGTNGQSNSPGSTRSINSRAQPVLTSSVPSSPNTSSNTLERPAAVRSAANIAVTSNAHVSSRGQHSRPTAHAGSEPPIATAGTCSSTDRKQRSSVDSLDPNHSTESVGSSKASVESLERHGDVAEKLPAPHAKNRAHSEDSGELLGSTGSSGTQLSPAPASSPAPAAASAPLDPASAKDSPSPSLLPLPVSCLIPNDRRNLRLDLCTAKQVGSPSLAAAGGGAGGAAAAGGGGGGTCTPPNAQHSLSLTPVSYIASSQSNLNPIQAPLSSSPSSLLSRLQVFAFPSDDLSAETAPTSPELMRPLPKHLVCTSGLSMRHASLFKQTAYSHLSKLAKKFILDDSATLAVTPSQSRARKSEGSSGNLSSASAGQQGAVSGDTKHSLQRERDWAFEQLAFAQLLAQSVESWPTGARNAPSTPTQSSSAAASEFAPLQLPSPDSGASISFTARSGSVSSPTRTLGRSAKRQPAAPATGSQPGPFGVPLAPLLCSQFVASRDPNEPCGPLPLAISLILRHILRILHHAADSSSNRLNMYAF